MPTILAVTIAIALGSALAVFLACVAWRRIKSLGELRSRELERMERLEVREFRA